jgi:hypothetical protein
VSWEFLSPALGTILAVQEDEVPDEKELRRFARFPWDSLEDHHLRRIRARHRTTGVAAEAVRGMISSKNRWMADDDPSYLRTLLSHSRNCRALDPGDKVYAFLGLTDESYAIIPNHSSSNTVGDIFIEAAYEIIVSHDRLDILLTRP